MRSPRCEVLISAVLALATSTAPAKAFDIAILSRAGEGNHGSITKECVQGTGLEKIANELAVATERVDWRDGPKELIGGTYLAKAHCDRKDGELHTTAFNSCYNYFQHTFNYSLSQASGGDRPGAIKELGRWIHTLEDAYSHGNAAWEAPGAAAIRKCFSSPVLTGFEEANGAPTNDNCTIPSALPGNDNAWKYYLTAYPNGERPHSEFATDSKSQNSSATSVASGCISSRCGAKCTRFECSYFGAVETCRAAAQTFFARCNADCRRTLLLEQIDGNARAFQALDSNTIIVLGTDNKLWREHGPFGTVPPGREQIDGNARAFLALDSNTVFVLGTDNKLWREHAPFGPVPPAREQVDGNVLAFQAVNGDTVFTLGTDNNLWREHGPFGTVPPAREQVDGNVRAYQALDSNTVLVLGIDNKLWIEHGSFGPTPPRREQIDGNVQAFQALDPNTVFALGTDGKLWREHGPFGAVPPAREQVDGNARAFQALDSNTVLVMGTDGKLWREHGPFGTVPPPASMWTGTCWHSKPSTPTLFLFLGQTTGCGASPVRSQYWSSTRSPAPCHHYHRINLKVKIA